MKTERDKLLEQRNRLLIDFCKEARRVKLWRRVAVVAVVACPGSFVAGGLLLQELLGWWW